MNSGKRALQPPFITGPDVSAKYVRNVMRFNAWFTAAAAVITATEFFSGGFFRGHWTPPVMPVLYALGSIFSFLNLRKNLRFFAGPARSKFAGQRALQPPFAASISSFDATVQPRP